MLKELTIKNWLRTKFRPGCQVTVSGLDWLYYSAPKYTFYKYTFSPLFPPDAIHKRGLCLRAVFVCPWLSVYCVKMSKHNPQTFSPSGNHTILVFHAKPMTIF